MRREERGHGGILALVEVQNGVLGRHCLQVGLAGCAGAHVVLLHGSTGGHGLEVGVLGAHTEWRSLALHSIDWRLRASRHVSLVSSLQVVGDGVAWNHQVLAHRLGHVRSSHNSWVKQFILVDIGHCSVQLGNPHRHVTVAVVVL